MTKTEATVLVDTASEGISPRRIGKRKLPDARGKWIHTRCNAAERQRFPTCDAPRARPRPPGRDTHPKS
jgi:hypothetical protein